MSDDAEESWVRLDTPEVELIDEVRFCGQPIDPERIEVVPETRLCVDHARMIVKHGGEFVVTGTQARIDQSLLQSGHTYIFGVINQLIMPNAADGDFETVSFPIENATTWSHSIVVQ